MNDRHSNLDITLDAGAPPRQQLVEVLEHYMAELERGEAPDQQAFLAAHPELADELRPYLESLRLLDGATRDIRTSKLAGSAATPGTGRQIGEYRIVREIGRGGMGIVYEAHQKSLNRRVALKILPFAAVLDQRQIARFRNEAQAAAQLHHPHIVPVFAVGQEQGVYYYAMQFIEGQSLEQAISDLRANGGRHVAGSTKARGAQNGSTTTIHHKAASALLSAQSAQHGDFYQTVARLGREAATALQHAHENGIVHRDVKPSNLMIDGHGKLWVTDFGLARIQNDNGVTLTGDVVGTLRYMSPEQAGGGALVDARTDVYSLGLTLYELLTQTHAHSGEDRQLLLRQIINEEPIAPRKINPAVPLDLETIVLGAMAKARDDRYVSAQALADDLERFLEGKPTLARRPTLVDRAGKWARRHRPLVAVAASAIVLLSIVSVVGLVLLAREQSRTSVAFVKAERSAQSAQQSLERAERYFKQARSAVDQLGVRLSDQLTEIPGAESVRRDLLLDTLNYYREFAKEAGNDPQLRHEAALAHFRSAVLAAKVGAVGDAISEYAASQEILTDLINTESDTTDARAQLAVSHNNLGLLYAGRSDTTRARQEYADAIRIQQAILKDRPDNSIVAGQLAESQANLGLLLDQLDDYEGAMRALRGAVEVLRPLANADLTNPKPNHDLAIALNNLSFVLRNKDAAAAEKASREAIDILKRLANQPKAESDYHDDLALCYNNLAALQSRKGDWNEAIAAHQHAIELQEQIARKSPAVVRHRSEWAISLNNLGVAYCRASKPADADAAFGRARELFATLAKDYPDELAYRSLLAAQLNNQALALAGAGRHADALPIYAAAIEAQKNCHDQAPNSALLREALSKMYFNFGQSLRNQQRWQEAMDAALARRELWTANSERLLGVAVELADLDTAMYKQSAAGKNKEKPDVEAAVLSTLERAYDNGWLQEVAPATDKRLATLKSNERYAAKIAELNERATKKRKASQTESN